MTGGYTPNPVPQDPRGLPEFLSREFQRIQELLSGAVQRSYGGMLQTGDIIVPLTPVPIILNVYDTVQPTISLPEGVEPNLATGELIILSPGVYTGSFESTNNLVPVNSSWDFIISLNGVTTLARASVEPSNQTSRISVGIEGLGTFAKGDIIAVLVSSDTSTTWTAEDSHFYVNRVSEVFP